MIKVILLAGGLGTRLRPITDAVPKCLVPIAGRPLLDYWFDRFAAVGVRDVLINTHHLAEEARKYIAAINARGSFRVTEAHEPTLLGSAGTIAANRDFLEDGDLGLIVYADNLSDVELEGMLRFHRGHGDPFTMLLYRAPKPEACGIALLDDDGRIVEFVEKPSRPKSNLANGGVYAVTSAAYHEIADMRKFDLAFDVLPAFVGRMRGWEWTGYHRDIGNLDALRAAESDAPRVFGLTPRASDSGPAIGAWAARPAVFLDRDGTIIDLVHYLSDPNQVRLIPGAGEAIAKLRRAGYSVVLVTNQSGVGRGFFDETRLGEIHDEMNRQLLTHDARLDGLYFCPVVPTSDDPTVIDHHDRKPGPGMLFRARDELGLDLARSWMIGDSLGDLLAGRNARLRGSLLVRTGYGDRIPEAHPAQDGAFADIAAAVDWLLAKHPLEIKESNS